jgi:hypothetical protein
MGEINVGGVWFGSSVGTAGDVNGDGFGDVIVGAPLYSNGAAYAYFGSPSGLPTTANWTGASEGTYVAAHYGASVGTAGDVNGDGFDDLIVGAYLDTNDQYMEGRAYAYYGPQP